ncbi:MAG: pyridoxal phosphate-dependent aminotransferase family protein [Spirochaetales bacterium]|jgi:8-amino-7-oxononanoate synthase|nr:pyridoxal phosphate-dependent aminotransferase family protein [Spirochaetales bacterium]
MDIFTKCFELTKPKEFRKKGIYPYFHCLETRQDKEVIMEGNRKIMLGSNNYLGLTTCPEVIDAAQKALSKYGTGCSGSRFLNGTIDLHYELENELANFLHKDGAVIFSTGFMSNLGIISAIVGKNDYVICDKENHASIYDGCKLSYGTMLRYNHSDMDQLEKQLQKVPEGSGCLIVTDGIFSMRGDLAKLPEIVSLAKKYGARVMVDDAHSLGVIGKGGRGTASYFGLENEVDIYMGTFSKSLASLGGYMAADFKIVDFVRHSSRPFIFSASLPPASTASALAALRYLENHPELPEKLKSISDYARKAYERNNIAFYPGITPIVPIYTKDSEYTLRLATNLYNSGVYVNPVLPPATPENECLLRTSLMATVTEDLVDEAAIIIAKEIAKLDKHEQ